MGEMMTQGCTALELNRHFCGTHNLGLKIFTHCTKRHLENERPCSHDYSIDCVYRNERQMYLTPTHTYTHQLKFDVLRIYAKAFFFFFL